MKDKIPSKNIRHLVKPLSLDKLNLGDKVYCVPVHNSHHRFSYDKAYLGTILKLIKY